MSLEHYKNAHSQLVDMVVRDVSWDYLASDIDLERMSDHKILLPFNLPLLVHFLVGGNLSDDSIKQALEYSKSWIYSHHAASVFDDILDGELELTKQNSAIGFLMETIRSLTSINHDETTKIIRVYSESVTSTLKGQSISYDPNKSLDQSVSTYMERIYRISGNYLGSALTNICLLANQSQWSNHCFNLGVLLGSALQIIDDCNDFAEDLRNKHITLPHLYTASDPAAFGILQTLVKSESDSNSLQLSEIFTGYSNSGLVQSMHHANKLLSESMDVILRLPEGAERDLLVMFISNFLERTEIISSINN